MTIHSGATLLEAAHQVGIILNTVCGSRGTCGKCAVILQPENQTVLACQYKIDCDLTIEIPSTSRFFDQKILAHGIDHNVDIDLPKIAEKAYGLAIDIGTTTVVAKVLDLSNGELIATETAFNPQAKHGDDVISRIAYAHNNHKLRELQSLIIACINELIACLIVQAEISAQDIYEMTVVANTTMNHIFLNLPIKQLGLSPYEAWSLDACDLKAQKLSININPEANIHTVENIAGFIGSDTVAAALATAIDCEDELTLLIDIGTNGELICGNKEKLYAASCAAGPALEGARISQGSRAVSGAIEAVVINDNDIDVDVINDHPSSSICGSGVIDAVAVMLDLKIIDRTGRFNNVLYLKDQLPDLIYRRMTTVNHQPAFVLAYENDSKKPAVTITQQDVRELQLAKAAIRAGINMLLKKLKLKDDDLKKILLAGAFGNYIRKSSAMRIGLLPNVNPERIHFVGNAASTGAQMILINQKVKALATDLAKKVEYIEIAHEKDFTNLYTEAMLF